MQPQSGLQGETRWSIDCTTPLYRRLLMIAYLYLPMQTPANLFLCIATVGPTAS